ncbi:MAG TPA: hypothetical protein VF338_06420 [Leptolinea sp.]
MDTPLVKKQNFSLVEFLQIFLHGWKILAVGVIIGGIAGLAASALLKPEYETTAVYSFSFDLARTGLLTDIEEDQAMEIAGDLINSTDVLKDTIARAGEMGIVINFPDNPSIFQTERRFNQWLLKIRWNDQVTAAKLANLWGEAARSAFVKAQQSATKADAIQRYILSLESCFQQSTSGLPAQPLCQVSNRVELQSEMQKSGEDLQKWREESRGIFPGLNFVWSQEAQIPTAPVQHTRGSLVLAGGLTGLLAAAIISLLLVKNLN